jgi:pSer/pThr/pTyr-binding forkhead associated (FHA) protein
MKAQLVVVYGKPRNTVKSLSPGDCLIGRGDECQVRTNSPLVSRQHCLVHVSSENAVVRDLGSTNGTLVNGKRITCEHELAPGDLVQIGPVVFEFRDVSNETAEPAPAIRVDTAGGKPLTGDLPTVDHSEALTEMAGTFQREDARRQTVAQGN